jgi:hypothetical protein
MFACDSPVLALHFIRFGIDKVSSAPSVSSRVGEGNGGGASQVSDIMCDSAIVTDGHKRVIETTVTPLPVGESIMHGDFKLKSKRYIYLGHFPRLLQ